MIVDRNRIDLKEFTMNTPRMILVPIDLSERSLQGLDYAAMLATATGAGLVLYCNINLPERAALEEFGAAEHLIVDDAGLIQLRQFAKERAPGIEASFVVGYNESPAHGILDAAETHDVDLIVVASHGRAGMTRWLLGSVAEKIARTADVPVVIVPTRGPSTDQ
jgi:nucleotide-binding universal stress UspA family protein